MDYQRIYDRLIADRRSKPIPDGYTEKHHIVPRSLGGSNRKENIVRLTPGDHLFAHKLLAKIHNTRGMWFAYLTMCTDGGKSARGIISKRRDYDRARMAYAAKASDGHHMKGRKYTDEEKAYLSSRSPRLSGKDHAMWGRKHSDETRAKLRASSPRASGPGHAMWGRKHTPEAIERMRLHRANGKSPLIKPDIYHFIHRDGEEFVGRKWDFCNHIGIPVSDANACNLVNGKAGVKSVKGWRLKNGTT